MANVRFYQVDVRSKFDALPTKDPLALYWIEETKELYKGSLLFGTGAMASEKAAGLLSAEDYSELRKLIDDGTNSDAKVQASAKFTTVVIPAANWVGDINPWSQIVTVNGVTANSKVDLQPTATQIVALQNAEITLMLQNDSGVVTAWAIGNKPTEDYSMQALITEVVPV